MRILIDLQCCQSGSRFGGIGRYSMSLAKAMLSLNSRHDFFLLLNGRLPNENAIRAEFADLMPQQNILTFEVPSFIAADNELPAHTRMAELIREKRIAEINPDVLHIASLFEGAGEDVVTSVGLLFPAERTAVTLYDLIPYLEQETYLINDILRDHYLRKLAGLKRAAMIVSISDFSRTEALQNTAIPASRIANISSAVDSQFRVAKVETETRIALLKNAGITKPFLMFTGSFDVRKNHQRLVEAFARVPLALRSQHQLVIVGKGDTSQIKRLRAIAREHELGESDLVFVGHVADAELIALYNLCSLFVFPSLREGFGLPVLEAMSCGVPTIGSNRTSVPEVINRADALFDPEDVDDIAIKIAAVLGDSAFSAELKQHGLARAQHFSWALSARKALAFFEDNLAAPNASFPMRASSPETSQLPDNELRAYNEFLDACTKIHIDGLDEGFLESATRAIAMNEFYGGLETRNDCRGSLGRIGWVSSWEAEDALTVYSKQLIPLLPFDITVFAPLSQGSNPTDGESLIGKWCNANAGFNDQFSESQQCLAESVLDTVVIQFRPDFLAWSSLETLIQTQKRAGKHVFVTLHAIDGLADLSVATGKLEIRRALKSCDAIFAHSMSIVRVMEIFGINKRVHFLPSLDSRIKQAHSGQGTDARHLIADYFLRKMQKAIACNN